jgi:predicted DNA-binding protein with PD1-like motif
LLTLLVPSFQFNFNCNMKYRQLAEHTSTLIIDKGEDVISTITEVAKDNNIQNAFLSGLGAVEKISCGYYNLEEKKYYFINYEGLFEVVSMTGNIMLKEGQPFVHLHAVFTDENNQAFGGHVEEMRVGVTLEVQLNLVSGNIRREYNQDIGLFLICPD